MDTILVTGAAGFIGSNLCEMLLKKGHKVIAIDNMDESYYSREMKERNISEMIAQDDFIFHEADVSDKKEMEKIFSTTRPDKVVHLAARAGVRPSIERPTGHVRHNVEGTTVILEQVKRHGIKGLVFASSSSVYGNTRDIPFREEADVSKPISPYAATKVAGETLCHTYHHLYGIDITCLRFFTVYGPKGRPDMAIGKWTEKISRDEPIELYGNGDMERFHIH